MNEKARDKQTGRNGNKGIEKKHSNDGAFNKEIKKDFGPVVDTIPPPPPKDKK